jgi:hypothetical protein
MVLNCHPKGGDGWGDFMRKRQLRNPYNPYAYHEQQGRFGGI